MKSEQHRTTPQGRFEIDLRAGRALVRRPAVPRVSVVVPAKNEALNLRVVLPTLPEVHEVILVDGNSTDGTVQAALETHPGIRIVHQTRRGKGNALACGFEAATGDVIVMFDADGSADASEIEAFVAALTQGADVAKGSRFTSGGGSHDITRLRSLGNWFLNLLANVFFGTRNSDMCYGYVAFWRDALPHLDLPATDLEAPAGEMLWGDGFEVETLITCRAAVAGLRVVEVPSFEYLRIHGRSNLNAFSDGIRVLRTIFAERRRAKSLSPTIVRSAPETQAARSAIAMEPIPVKREPHLEDRLIIDLRVLGKELAEDSV